VTEPESESRQRLLTTAMRVSTVAAAVSGLVLLWKENVGLILLTLVILGAIIFIGWQWRLLSSVLSDGSRPLRRRLGWLSAGVLMLAVLGAGYLGKSLASRTAVQRPDDKAEKIEIAESVSDPIVKTAPDPVAKSLPDSDASRPADPAPGAGTGPTRAVRKAEPDPPPEPPPATPAPPRCADLAVERVAFDGHASEIARRCMMQMTVSRKRALTCRASGGTVTLRADYRIVGSWRNDESVIRFCYKRSGPFDAGAIRQSLVSGNFRDVCAEKSRDSGFLDDSCAGDP
jgi:hypothetical protein